MILSIFLFTFAHKQRIYALENAMLLQDITIPVYFSKYNAELETVVSDLSRISLEISEDAKQAAQRESALENLINSISANGYQVIIHTHCNVIFSMRTEILHNKFPIIFIFVLGSSYRRHSFTKQTIENQYYPR